jgi:hypothetical protein
MRLHRSKEWFDGITEFLRHELPDFGRGECLGQFLDTVIVLVVGARDQSAWEAVHFLCDECILRWAHSELQDIRGVDRDEIGVVQGAREHQLVDFPKFEVMRIADNIGFRRFDARTPGAG